jgi:hypothetical protein
MVGRARQCRALGGYAHATTMTAMWEEQCRVAHLISSAFIIAENDEG